MATTITHTHTLARTAIGYQRDRKRLRTSNFLWISIEKTKLNERNPTIRRMLEATVCGWPLLRKGDAIKIDL